MAFSSFHGTLSRDRVFHIALACIVVLAVLVRVHQLGADDLWTDEAFTGFLALTPEWLSYLRIDNTPPLYYLILRLWCGVGPCGEVGLRLPSVVAGVVFIFVTGVFFRRAVGRRAALVMALIAALSPVHVYYSQEARVYAILLTTLLLFLFLQWQVVHEKATTARWILLFVVGVCALYLHYLSLIAIGAYALVYLAEKAAGWRDVPRGYFLAVGTALACFVPWILLGLLGSQSSSSELAWIAEYFEDKPLWQLPVRTLTTFLIGPELHLNELSLFLKRYADMDIPAIVYLVSALLTFLCLGLYIVTLAGIRALPGPQQAALLEASAFMFLPLLGLAAASLLFAPIYVVGRYDLIAFPGFLLVGGTVAGVAFAREGPLAKPLAGAALGALVVVLISTQVYKIVTHRQTVPHQGPVRTETRAVAGRLENGDGLLVARPQAAQVWYYLHLLGFERENGQCIGNGKRFTCRLSPVAMEQAPASLERFTRMYDDEAPSFDIGYFVADLSNESRVILMLSKVELADGNVEIDRIGGGIVASLRNAGWSFRGADSEYNYLVFSRNAAGG